MKNLSLIIFVLAGTIFAACSKKSGDSGNNNNQDPYYYNNNGYINSSYPQNGYRGQNQLLVFNTNLGCNGQTPPLINNLVDYCSWLAEEARYSCDINAVKREFMGRCMHVATTYNFCVGGSTGGYYYYSSSYGGRRSSGGSGRVREEPIRHSSGSRTTETDIRPTTTAPSTPVTTLPTAVVVAPAPQQHVVSQPAQTQTSTQTKCVDKVVKINPEESDLYLRSKHKVDGKVLNYDVYCVTEYAMNGCKKIGSNDRIKISEESSFEVGRRASNRVAALAEDNMLECKQDKNGDGKLENYSKVTWNDLAKRCGAVTITEKIVRECEETAVVQAPQSTAQTSPAVDTGAGVKVLDDGFKELPAFLNKCFNLEDIHNDIINPDNKLASFSRQYIVTELPNLTASDKLNITEALYNLPLNKDTSLGSHRMSPDQTTGNRTGSAIAATVTQANERLILNGVEGEIVACRDNNYMEVAFKNGKNNKEYIYKFTLTRQGEMSVNAITDETLVNGQSKVLLSLNYIIWKDLETVDALSKFELQKDLGYLSRELLRDQGYTNVEDLIRNTLNVISTKTTRTAYEKANEAADDARQAAINAAFRKSYESSTFYHKRK